MGDSPVLLLAKAGALPDTLGFNSIAKLFAHQDNLNAFKARGWLAENAREWIDKGWLPTRGHTAEWLKDAAYVASLTTKDETNLIKEPLIDRAAATVFLQALAKMHPDMRLWPLPDECLLRYWLIVGPASRNDNHMRMDAAFKRWLSDNPDGETMTVDEIREELQAFDSGLFSSGYQGWWKSQSVLRLKSGRKRKAK